MKKLAMILLCVALVFSCAFVAFADPTPSDYIITVENPTLGETYTAYKIFDVTYNEATPPNPPSAYTYTIGSDSEWWSIVTTPSVADPTLDTTADTFTVDGLTFTKTAQTSGNNGYVYVVTFDETLDQDGRSALAKTLADKLYAADLSGKTVAASDTADSSTLDLDVGGDGYYFVTTTLGALCALNTTTPTATVREKNDYPTVEKKVSTDNSLWLDTVNATIGQTVYFRIQVTDGLGTDQAITVADTMSAGLDLDYSGGHTNVTVHVDGSEVEAGSTTYTLTETDEQHWTIVFAASYVASLTPDSEVYITYTGRLNTSAQIAGNTNDTSVNPAVEAYNTNSVLLTYSAQSSADTVTVNTYAFDIVKTDSDSNIIGPATFKLYNAATGGSQYPLTLVSSDTTNNVYTYIVDPDNGSTSLEIQAYRARILGVGEGTYYLEEVAAPSGYNKIDTRESVSMNAANNYATLAQNDTKWASSGVHIVNETGSQMPSTGGIGTYLFTGVGAILIVGAVVVLVSKKRMHAYSD